MSIELNPITDPTKIGGINANLELIEDELNNNVFRRKGVSPGEANQLEIDLDLNSNDIINIRNFNAQDGIVDGVSIKTQVDNAASSAAASAASATTASNAADAAEAARDLVSASFDSVADMQAATFLQVGMKVRTVGYYAPGDGGGNDYEIVASATGTVDGGSFIDLDNGLQAKGLFSGGIHLAEQWGAKGDLINDDTSAIQAGVDFGDHLQLLDKSYLYSGITLPSNDFSLRGTSRGTSKLVYSQQTGNGITIGQGGVTTNNVYVTNLWMAQVPGVERTSGAHIAGYNFTHSAIKDIYFTDSYKGIFLVGVARSEIVDVWFRVENGRTAPQSRAIELAHNSITALGVVNCKIVRADGAGSTSWLEQFITINAADWILIDQCHVNKANFGLVVTNDFPVYDLWVTNTYFDEAPNVNVRFLSGVGTIIRKVVFDNCYFRLSGTRNVSFEQSAVIEDVKFQTCRFGFSGSHALFMGSENIEYLSVNGSLFDNSSTGGIAAAISVKALRTDVSHCIFNNTAGPTDLTVNRSASSGTLRVLACEFIGSAATPLTYSNIAQVRVSANNGLSDDYFPKLENYGAVSVTTDASGIASFPHSLQTSPAFATAGIYTVGDDRVNIVSTDATNISVFIYSTVDNSPKASVTRNIKWFAKV